MNDIASSARHSIGLLILRVGSALLLIHGHGWGKLVGFSERSGRFSDPLGVGSETSLALVVFAEVFCALAVLLGLFTRVAVIPLIIFFAVAALIQHAQDPWAKKEMALIYMVPFLTLLFTGAGRYSLDAVIGRWRARRKSHRSTDVEAAPSSRQRQSPAATNAAQ